MGPFRTAKSSTIYIPGIAISDDTATKTYSYNIWEHAVKPCSFVGYLFKPFTHYGRKTNCRDIEPSYLLENVGRR